MDKVGSVSTLCVRTFVRNPTSCARRAPTAASSPSCTTGVADVTKSCHGEKSGEDMTVRPTECHAPPATGQQANKELAIGVELVNVQARPKICRDCL